MIMRYQPIFFRTIISCLLLPVLFTSCKKWLDVTPQNQVVNDKLFAKEQGFKDALTGVYIKLTETPLYGKEMTFGLVDAVGQTYTFDNMNGANYLDAQNYLYTSGAVQTRVNAIWQNAYNAISNLNSLIEQLDKADTTLFQPRNYKAIKGEALGLRAFLHFDLLRLFAPSFAAGGADKPAIPYVTKYSTAITAKSTGRVVTDNILADLTASSALLAGADPLYTGETITADIDEGYLLNRKLRFNYYAARALQARVYLWAGDKVNALKTASEVIAAAPLKFPWVARASVTVATDALKNRTFTTEHIFSAYILNMQVNTRPYMDTTIYNGDRLTVTDSRVTELFETGGVGATDYRYLYFIKRYTIPSPPFSFFRKLAQPDGMPDTLAKRQPLIRIAEMYYIAAECDLSRAAEYLNLVRTNRGITVAIPANADADQLNAEIQKEYRKELINEGQIFFYYKRWNKTAVPGITGTFNTANYVFLLPATEIEFGR
jgi:hypothetical protein